MSEGFRTSLRQSARDKQTVVLSQAFKNAGLGAEYIGQSANLLQKALGGVNEMGGHTDAAFRRLGTSIQQLKPLSYVLQHLE